MFAPPKHAPPASSEPPASYGTRGSKRPFGQLDDGPAHAHVHVDAANAAASGLPVDASLVPRVPSLSLSPSSSRSSFASLASSGPSLTPIPSPWSTDDPDPSSSLGLLAHFPDPPQPPVKRPKSDPGPLEVLGGGRSGSAGLGKLAEGVADVTMEEAYAADDDDGALVGGRPHSSPLATPAGVPHSARALPERLSIPPSSDAPTPTPTLRTPTASSRLVAPPAPLPVLAQPAPRRAPNGQSARLQALASHLAIRPPRTASGGPTAPPGAEGGPASPFALTPGIYEAGTAGRERMAALMGLLPTPTSTAGGPPHSANHTPTPGVLQSTPVPVLDHPAQHPALDSPFDPRFPPSARPPPPRRRAFIDSQSSTLTASSGARRKPTGQLVVDYVGPTGELPWSSMDVGGFP